jgi:pimeloyl-ACP methyl ester carboxylesterase
VPCRRWHGPQVGPHHHVGIEDGDQGVEVAFPGGGHEGVDHFALAVEVGVGDTSLALDATARQDGPTVVAGHSYGGQIITALGADAPNAVGLVYIAAFGLDEGESIGGLLAQGPPTPALAHLDIDKQGFAWLPEDDFVNHFAADVDPVKARVMYAVQQPLAASALQDVMGVPAWKSLPTWYLVAEGDQAIPPDAERQFAGRMGATTVEVPTNHVAMVSHPDGVVQLIKTAAEALAVAT